MHYRLSRLAIVVALACSVGLQWGFLQSVAWLGMVVRYAQDETVIKALARTFDGKHPCALCKAIAKGKQAEKKAEFPDARKKFEFSYSASVFVFGTPLHFWQGSGLEDRADSLSRPPPVPPPRLSLG